VFDSATRHPISVCGVDPREFHVMTSRTSRVSVELTNPSMIKAIGAFILEYNGRSILSSLLPLKINSVSFWTGNDKDEMKRTNVDTMSLMRMSIFEKQYPNYMEKKIQGV